MDLLIIWIIAIGLFALFAVPFIRKKKDLELRTDQADLFAEQYGLKEPVTLHPVIDPNACIGSGQCIAVCPEQDVLGLRNGQAIAVSPASCIGHGLCERACPVEAIQLVFGTEKRGVDIPRIKANFETNIDHIYIIGELGGMGLIRNAFEQGRQCIEDIISDHKKSRTGLLDLVIIGCGPAGLSATIQCKHHQLNFVTLEKDNIGGAVNSYPRKKLVMTTPIVVPGYGKLSFKEISKEELITVWDDIQDKLNIRDHIQTNTSVQDIIKLDNGAFRIITNAGNLDTMRVVLAIGRRGVPRKLEITGEDLPNVFYSLREAESFENDRITVVGGGDSAVEAALALAQQPGNMVRLSYRRDAFSRIKQQNRVRIHEAMDKGSIEVLWSTSVIRNERDAVTIQFDGGKTETLPNDYLFIFAGGVLPMEFLKKLGIEIETKFGVP